MFRPFVALAIAVVGLAWLVAPVATRAQDFVRPAIEKGDIEAGFRTDWFGMYLQGKKIGHFRTARDKTDEGIRESFAMQMKIVSFGQKAEMNIEQTLVFEPKEPHGLLRGEFKQVDSSTKLHLTLERKGNGFRKVLKVGNEVRESDVPAINYMLADAMASEVWLRRRPKEGDEITYRDFDIQDQKIEGQKAKVLSVKSAIANGVPVKYYEIDSQSKRDMLSILSRHDDTGRMLSGKFAIFELRLESEEEAKNTTFSQDLFILGMAKIDRPLGKTGQVKELVVEVDPKEGGAFEDGPRQTIVKENGKVIVKLGKKYGKEEKATEKDVEENLRETNAHAINHPKVKELAEKAVGDAKTPEEKVKRIVAFVHGYVRPSLTASMPNIHDLMEKKKGDCKSYALLTTNLARAAGVPAREVSGLLYIGDDQKAFGGHAWNEVVLNGVWVPVDASMGETEVNATHISFGADHRASKNLLTTLGKLNFKLVETK
ncbi:MAG: transglutaminase-like domain-containing protein [Gemmataceae bacterium]|nr:transglutaminase-like domain-containing protein [Gemmataceae bacterium]